MIELVLGNRNILGCGKVICIAQWGINQVKSIELKHKR